jgi:hypothetical protein
MSGIVGVSPVRRIGVAGALRAMGSRCHDRLHALVERVRADGGLPLAVALPLAVSMTAALSCLIVVVASAARPL